MLDEPFSGLDPVNQERLEAMILAERDRGATILLSTHVMAHAQRLCDRLAIIAGGKRQFEGTVEEARATLPDRVRYRPREPGADRRDALLPADAVRDGADWRFVLPGGGIEPTAGPADRRRATASPACRSNALGCTKRSCGSSATRPLAREGADGMSDLRRSIRQTLTIARRDFIATVFTPIFLLFLFAPVIMGSFGAIGGMGAASVADGGGGGEKSRIVAIVHGRRSPGRSRRRTLRLRGGFRPDEAPPAHC